MSEAEILAEVVEPGKADFPLVLAEAILRLRFNDEAKQRMRELLDKNNRGTITPVEVELMDRYRHIGQLIDLLQAKSRLCLREAASKS